MERGLDPTAAGEERENGTGKETELSERETAVIAIDNISPERRKVAQPRGLTAKIIIIIIIIRAKGAATKTEAVRKKNNAAVVSVTEED